MTWEIAIVVGVYSVPLLLGHMIQREMQQGEESSYYFWIRLFVFFINLAIVDAGLWVTQMIAVMNDAAIGGLLTTIWRVYSWAYMFILLITIIIVIFKVIKENVKGVWNKT